VTERDNPGTRPGRQPAEGVRIIKAEEAQAALDAGEAAGRRPDDQLRFGDVPPVPQGPRPAHRFPLPDSVDPAEAVSLPPLAPRPPGSTRARGADPQPNPSDLDPQMDWASEGEPADGPPTESLSIPPLPPEPEPEPTSVREPPDFTEGPGAGYDPGPYEAGPSPAITDVPPPPPRYAPPPVDTWAASAETATGGDQDMEADAPPWARPVGNAAGSDSTTELATDIPAEGITVSGAGAEMPHWSDPPTGEVPRLRFDDDVEEGDEMEAWRALGARGVRWRDEHGWDEGDELSDLAPEAGPVGALDQNRTEHSDLYSFDEDFERVTSRTGSSPVVDLTSEGYGEASDDDWARIDTGTPRTAGRTGRGRRWERGRGSSAGERKSRRFVASSGAGAAAAAAGAAAAGAGAAGAGAGAGSEQVGAGLEEVAGAPAGAAAVAAGVAGVAAGSGSGWPGAGDPTVASTTSSEPAAARRVSTSTSTREAERPGRPDRPGGGPTRRPPAAGGGDVGNRVVVGVGLFILLLIAFAIGSKALVVLSAVVVVAAAAEAYNMTRAPGFRPATLLGLVATVGCVFGAYWKGLGAIPVVTVLLFVGTMLWYVLGVVEARPLANAAVTVMVFVWVSVLGSFSAVLLQAPHGKGLFFGAVIVAVAADVFAFVVGRWIGSRPMAPSISPHKTIEGFLGGLVGALIVGAIVGKTVHPWSGMRYGLILGLVIGLIAPVGDLFESMLKRDLGIKDSGTVLGGHGGLLDRFDGILLALPAAYFVATIAHIA
jgi:CDP-diglyceride synthetase